MFLETITALGNDVLVPINRIKFVFCVYREYWELHIVSDDGDWAECFDNTDDLDKRYRKIKKLLKIAEIDNGK